jgi:endoglucanase
MIHLRIHLPILLGACSLSALAQTLSPFIAVDQFGYRPDAAKIAVIRDPVTGFDAAESFTPGTSYALVDSATGTQVHTGAPTAWKNGATDSTSGDKVWHFDFSSVKTEGTYYVLDVQQKVRSPYTRIGAKVYHRAFREAFRIFFYQRAGFAKAAPYAEGGWVDGASHVGAGQDRNARLFNKTNDASTERDLHGAWYDAGDFNKYTAWNADYLIQFLHAWEENKSAWGDDMGIPESGNQIPDILDEMLWGLQWQMRMQNADGSCLSVMGLSGASPPSAATGPSRYGPANTIATRRTAAAFALGSTVLRRSGLSQFKDLADSLQGRALSAWTWAEAHPDSVFNNNSSDNGSSGLAAGNQETDKAGRDFARIQAATYLFELTGETKYRQIVDDNYRAQPLLAWSNFVQQYWARDQGLFLYYAALPQATPAVATALRQALLAGYKKNGDYLGALRSQADPYRAYIKDYNWGSNAYKSLYGLNFWEMAHFNLEPASQAEMLQAAQDYLHSIHGRNPLGLVYLSNMVGRGAERGVTQFYHTWYADGSARWDEVGKSTFGPAPGFLVGGPNSSYDVDGCCPANCGGAANNALCTAESVTPPKGQPPQKSYKDFNTNWPLNSWSVTENSNGYQLPYLRLLSKFVEPSATALPMRNPRQAKRTDWAPRFRYRLGEGELQVEALGQPGATQSQVRLLDLSGRVLAHESRTLSPGWNRIPLGLNLSKGMFWVRVDASPPALLVR